MATSNFYEDRRYCVACRAYVHYLLSPRAAYCASCGEVVQLFSPPDLERFRGSLGSERPEAPRGRRAAPVPA
jgi:hypothetical protein